MIELERTYLAKYLPDDLEKSEKKEIIDIYIPENSVHPCVRIRKNGDKYEITKKTPLKDDPSEMREQTIKLTEKEFEIFSKLPGRRVSKIRYLYPYKDRIAEFDVFQEALKGLVVIDFEFKKKETKDSFEMPEFCLADVTGELFIAGGMICGKSYEDIKSELDKFDYKIL
jgi:adenylate cyclase